MSLITRIYTFTDGTTAYGSQVDAEIGNIVNALNSLDQGNTTWTNVKVTTLLPQTDVNMGGHKITSVGTPTTAGDALVYPVTNAVITAQTIRGTTANSAGTAQEIAQGTISTPDIRAGAVTAAKMTLTTGDITQVQTSASQTSSHGTDLTTVTITTTGGKVLLQGTASITVVANGSGAAGVYLCITNGNSSITGAVNIANVSGVSAGSTQQFSIPVMVVDSPAAGTITYKLSYIINTGTFNSTYSYSLTAVELKA